MNPFDVVAHRFQLPRDHTPLGQRINAARVAQNLSWRQLGERCKLGESTIRCLCERRHPSWPIVVRVARALDLDLNELAGEKP